MSDLLKLAAKKKPGRHRRSVLDPYAADLKKLREQGYTLDQIEKMLASLGVDVTKQAIHGFLKKQEESEVKEVNK